MGSLIVLLVVVVQQAKATADDVAKQQSQQVAAADVAAGELASELEESDGAFRSSIHRANNLLLEHERQKVRTQLSRGRDSSIAASGCCGPPRRQIHIEQLAQSKDQQSQDANRNKLAPANS